MRRLVYRLFVHYGHKIEAKLREKGIEGAANGGGYTTAYGLGVLALEALFPRLAKL